MLVLAILSIAPNPLASQANGTNRAPTVAEAEAMEARLQAAIQIDPTVPSLHAELGDLLRSQARLADARDAFARAVQLEPMNAVYRSDLAQTHLSLEEFDQAEVHFRWATEIAPDDPAYFAGLGAALLAQDKVSEAVEALRAANSLQPGNEETEALLRSAQTTSRLEGDDDTFAFSVPSTIQSTLTWIFGTILVVAAAGLTLPLLASIVVLLLLVPRTFFEKRNP